MSKPQYPLGHGTIDWLGVNEERGKFSIPRDTITILEDGIQGDMYRGMWRKVSGHDGGYIATDGVEADDLVINHRQITIVDEAEVREASKEAGVTIAYGMLRENIVVLYTPVDGEQEFSKLPPLCRMVIGAKKSKVLTLNEENEPCRTISNPIAVHYRNKELGEVLKIALTGRRGQMASVRTHESQHIKVGYPFTIFPPLRS